MIDHALCIKAQDACKLMTDSVRPKYSPMYSRDHPPVPGFKFTNRAWSDVVTGVTYRPEYGWMKAEDYYAWRDHEKDAATKIRKARKS
jgi:hypothetical protein